MYASNNNICSFLGNVANDINTSTVGKGKNKFTKVVFTIAVRRNLTAEQREKAKNDNSIQKYDYVPCQAIGGTADFISNNFEKGSAISVYGAYKSYKTTDDDGNTKYGGNFEVIATGFVPNDFKNDDDDSDNSKSGNKRGNRSGRGNGRNSNNNKNNKNSKNNKYDDSDDDDDDDGDLPIDDEDIPF